MSEAKSTVSRECVGVNPSRENDTGDEIGDAAVSVVLSALRPATDMAAAVTAVADPALDYDVRAPLARLLGQRLLDMADEITRAGRTISAAFPRSD